MQIWVLSRCAAAAAFGGHPGQVTVSAGPPGRTLAPLAARTSPVRLSGGPHVRQSVWLSGQLRTVDVGLSVALSGKAACVERGRRTGNEVARL